MIGYSNTAHEKVSSLERQTHVAYPFQEILHATLISAILVSPVLADSSEPILATFDCNHASGSGFTPEADVFGLEPELSFIDHPGCENVIADTLFDDHLVALADVPTYLNSTAATDAKFEEFVENATVTPYCLQISQRFIDTSGEVISYGSGCGFGDVDILGEDIERIELLIGDETRVEYDPQSNVTWEYLDYTINIYGHAPAGRVVSIDIKPGSDPNCFNVNGHGVIPVAVFGSSSFDVADVDITTLSFGGLAVRMRGNKGSLCGYEDSNGDGIQDLVCHFEDDPSAWNVGSDSASLSGELLDGSPFEGSDSVCVVP